MEELRDELLPDAEDRVLTSSSLLKVGDTYYETQLVASDIFSIDNWINQDANFKLSECDLNPSIAYLIGDYYYLYRGKLSELCGFDKMKPGLYYDDDDCHIKILEPETEEEKIEYRYLDKITREDAETIRNAVLNHEVIIFNTPDSSHSVIPTETMDDDLLKRIIKRCIYEKGIDLDQYKTRFASKNMLFNTKQVLRGDNRLSMLLFDRCVEAFNLKYTIIVEENGGEIVGRPMKDTIILSSNDTFDTNIKIDSIVEDEEEDI